MSGAFDIETVVKEHRMNKLSAGLIVASTALFAIKLIIQIQLSKEYDRELKNDTKNLSND